MKSGIRYLVIASKSYEIHLQILREFETGGFKAWGERDGHKCKKSHCLLA